MPRRLTRDTQHAMLGGVAAGIGDYLEVDPVLVRVAFVLLAFLNGLGLLAYLVCWVIVPRRDATAEGPEGAAPSPADRIASSIRGTGESLVGNLHAGRGGLGAARAAVGVFLIVVGTGLLLDRLGWFYWPEWARFEILWPLILVAMGFALILRTGVGRTA